MKSRQCSRRCIESWLLKNVIRTSSLAFSRPGRGRQQVERDRGDAEPARDIGSGGAHGVAAADAVHTRREVSAQTMEKGGDCVLLAECNRKLFREDLYDAKTVEEIPSC